MESTYVQCRIVRCSLCVTCFMSPWSMSNSELDGPGVRLFAFGVIWWIGGGRLLLVVVGPLVILWS